MDNTVNPTEKGMLTMFLFDGMSAETGNAISGFFSQFGLPLILIAALIIMFVLSARSNKKRQKQYQSMLDGLKAGSRVRTIGGIYGTVTAVKGDVVFVSVGPDKVRLVFTKQAIASIPRRRNRRFFRKEIILNPFRINISILQAKLSVESGEFFVFSF